MLGYFHIIWSYMISLSCTHAPIVEVQFKNILKLTLKNICNEDR